MKNVLIIGGGVSGLSAGIYARLNGYNAVICEKHAVAGGNLTGWNRKGYHIDNCIHWLSGTNPNTDMYKTWCELGALGDVDIMYPETLYTVEHEGKRLSLYSDLNKLKETMLAISPEDGREITSFIDAVGTVQYIGGFGGINGNERYGTVRSAASLPKLMKYYRMTAGELAERFKHPLLKLFFRSFFTEWFGALALLFVFADFCGKNGGIPAGGSFAMAQRMIKRFEDLGGVLLTGKEAVKINEKNGYAESVLFGDGSMLFADHVIITCDPACVFGKMITPEMPEGLKKMYENKKLKRFSSVHCAFSCSEERLPFSGNYIIELGEKYRIRLKSKYLIVREYSHEPSFSPERHNIIQTMTFCGSDDAEGYIRLKNNEEAYRQRKEHIADLTREAIEERFPVLKGKTECIDVWTPATYHGFTGAEYGSYMSFAFSSKYLPVIEKNYPCGLANVTVATQWQKAPGGLPIAASAGKNAMLKMAREHASEADHHGRIRRLNTGRIKQIKEKQ